MPPKPPATHPALDLAAELTARYRIPELSRLLAAARASLSDAEITLAVLGRFKAGKSSFLNHLIGRAPSSGPLPTGVIPVTAAVTELRYGARESALIHYRDGRESAVPLDALTGYISEKENPQNTKQVDLITVELPELHRFRGLKFVDTTGLDSALSHNTQPSLDWLPNAGLALVAVSVDPPLSGRDIDLLKSLYQYTPKVSILLTKADLLTETELREVLEFVHAQLARNFSPVPQVFPYSTKPGFEGFRQTLEAALAETLHRLAEERQSVLGRKIDTLLRECGDYLALALKSAAMVESERHALARQVIGEKEIAGEVKSSVRLLVQHAASRTRAMVCERFESRSGDVERALLQSFESRFPRWTRSLSTMLSSFESWLAGALREELAALSLDQRGAFLAPLQQVRGQAFRALQQFRDGLSLRTERAFGVPLRTTESEIRIVEPAAPNIRIGRVFDRNWELLSPVLPAWMIRPFVHRHFAGAVPYLLEQNLSRLATQWEESIHAALREIDREAGRRLDEFLGTVERLIETAGDGRAPQLRADLDRIQAARLSAAPPPAPTAPR